MSMLTPPGMGGKYRITGDRYPRMRRPKNRHRIVFAAIGSALVLGLVGWGTLQLIDVFTGGGGSTAHASEDSRACRSKGAPSPSVRPLPKPTAITVNVYNATTRSGLAKDTADELRKRGFKVGKVGNAPAAYDKKVKGTGLLLGPKVASDGRVDVLATQLTGAQARTDARKGGDLDLIIGDGYRNLTAKRDADRALTALASPATRPDPTC
ncbi:LytR C-terminal domain-containing protein [Streptomyces sp. NPDC057702]|uniref:LytR C-terminal domain-containing protein n=1 Tax=unclassified Streptomyces TaxID=2593676 RepID=UPI00367C5200